MNDKTVIPCEQCRRSVRVPTNRGSIRVQCPHCQAIFIFPPVILTPDIMVTEKKCLKCGYVRHPDDDEFSFAGPTKCPMCLASYELAEKELLEEERLREYERTQKRIRLEEEQKKREWERERERTRLEREQQEQGREVRARMDREREAAKIAELFKPKAKMGVFMKIAVKTAVKKSLLEITDRLDLLHRQNPHLSIRERVEMFVAIAGMSNELPVCKHWEGTFSLLVIGQTRGQLTTLSNFNDYMPIILDLTADWINRVLGGKSENLYAEIIRLGSES
jgi:hypothetical protein